ncbi:MAG: response regulator transcription factor [Sedimentisphaerales bacterium]|jgi:DNA-binding response OmpR family regulator
MDRKKVLVVDDDRDFVHVTRVYLKAYGYDVVVASDAVEAVTVAKTEYPDIILLDIGLPKGDGLTVLNRLTSSDRTTLIPVIVVTGKDPSLKKSCLAAGAMEFFVKPFNPDVLLAYIDGVFHQAVGSDKK